MKRTISTKSYFATLIITIIIFGGALGVSGFITEKKTEELKTSIDKITVDILSIETQFDLLKDTSCSSNATSTIQTEITGLSNRLDFMEQQVGEKNPEVYRLKRYYSLLEIKDYLLRKKLADQCKTPDIFILYFYDTEGCAQCQTQEYMLKGVRTLYPNAHVYSFDYKLDLQAVTTLIELHNIPATPPIIDIEGVPYGPFENFSDMKSVIDTTIQARIASTTTTTTKKSVR
jgi:hypothetical protein